MPTPIKQGALHFDAGKIRLELIPLASLEVEAAGMEFGSIKYSRDDWRKGMVFTKLVASTLRHMVKYGDIETYDIESGVSHIGHAKACLGILAELIRTSQELDDRHDGVRREPYTVKEILEYRTSKGMETKPEMLSFIERNVEKAFAEYNAWKASKDAS